MCVFYINNYYYIYLLVFYYMGMLFCRVLVSCEDTHIKWWGPLALAQSAPLPLIRYYTLDYITTVFVRGEPSNFSSWKYYYFGFVGIIIIQYIIITHFLTLGDRFCYKTCDWYWNILWKSKLVSLRNPPKNKERIVYACFWLLVFLWWSWS